MERVKASTKIAGIDVAKSKLDVAVHGSSQVVQFTNDAEGFERLGAWLAAQGVIRVGLEATGGYERAVVSWLQANGYEVVIHQPIEVRMFAKLKRCRAKNDRLDAILIAADQAFDIDAGDRAGGEGGAPARRYRHADHGDRHDRAERRQHAPEGQLAADPAAVDDHI